MEELEDAHPRRAAPRSPAAPGGGVTLFNVLTAVPRSRPSFWGTSPLSCLVQKSPLKLELILFPVPKRIYGCHLFKHPSELRI